jgi:hypothetical protein
MLAMKLECINERSSEALKLVCTYMRSLQILLKVKYMWSYRCLYVYNILIPQDYIFSNSLSGWVDKYEHQQDDLVALMGLKSTNHKVLYVSYNSHWVLHRCQKSIPSLRSSSLEDSLMERDLLLSPDEHCDWSSSPEDSLTERDLLLSPDEHCDWSSSPEDSLMERDLFLSPDKHCD